MFRSVFRLTQTTARCVQAVSKAPLKPVSAFPVLRKYSSAVALSDEEQNAAFIKSFEREDMDAYDFKIAYMNLHQSDLVPEPEIIQAALYCCRRINNLPLAMRVLELVRVKCHRRQDIYDYLMQELKPTLDDLGLKTIEEYGLEQVIE